MGGPALEWVEGIICTNPFQNIIKYSAGGQCTVGATVFRFQNRRINGACGNKQGAFPRWIRPSLSSTEAPTD
jgi:hypothetical protein